MSLDFFAAINMERGSKHSAEDVADQARLKYLRLVGLRTFLLVSADFSPVSTLLRLLKQVALSHVKVFELFVDLVQKVVKKIAGILLLVVWIEHRQKVYKDHLSTDHICPELLLSVQHCGLIEVPGHMHHLLKHTVLQ